MEHTVLPPSWNHEFERAPWIEAQDFRGRIAWLSLTGLNCHHQVFSCTQRRRITPWTGMTLDLRLKSQGNAWFFNVFYVPHGELSWISCKIVKQIIAVSKTTSAMTRCRMGWRPGISAYAQRYSSSGVSVNGGTPKIIKNGWFMEHMEHPMNMDDVWWCRGYCD